MVELKDELLTVAEAAARLKVTRHTIYRWIAEGRLPAVRYSARVLRVRPGDLIEVRPGGSGRMGKPAMMSWKEWLAPYIGIISKEEGQFMRRAILEDRQASINDPE